MKAFKNGLQKQKDKTAHNHIDGLRHLLVEELKDIYWAEKEITRVMPKIIRNATSEELNNALNNHLKTASEQIQRLEKTFEALGEKPVAKKCEAMAGLIKETIEIIGETERGMVRDAAIILTVQKIEHYEIAAYGTLCSFANTLNESEVADLLEINLHEEKDGDDRLSEIAADLMNTEIFQEHDNEYYSMVEVKKRIK